MHPYLSIQQLSQETELEESLIRFYESEYARDLPQKVLKGGNLFFDACAVEAFKKVHDEHSRKIGNRPVGGDVLKRRYAQVVAVTSGKGGVGKTNIALNLAISFQRLGKMAIVVDADLGMANIHILAGVQPRYSLKDFVVSGLQVSEVITEGPEGIGIVPGGAGVLALADATPVERFRMVQALKDMERAADVIIVDTGAGMSAGVRDFLLAADNLLFVLTPDITSLADAYGLLKALHSQQKNQSIYTLVNMVSTLQQAADVALRFAGCVEQFLGEQVVNVGYLMKDSTVELATMRRTPFLRYDPQARVSKNLQNVAKELLKLQGESVAMHSSFQRYMNLLGNRD